jgi:hypothetical protein
MDIRDLLPAALINVNPSDSADLSQVVSLRVANTNAGWSSFRVMERDGSDITLSFPPGLTIETLEVRRVYATAPAFPAGVTVQAYVRGQ